MLSSCSWSRRRTSDLTLLKSSSGAMSAMISSTTFLHSSLVIVRCAELGDKALNNQRGIYPKHAEGIIQDSVHFRNLAGLIQHEPGQCALGIKVVDVDRRMNHQVVEGREFPRQFQRARRTHRVPDKA